MEALDELRVLDLSEGIPGGYCTKLLADAGARVDKVERPGGDPLRRWSASGAELAPGEDGALFQFLHTSKRGAVADLDTAEGRALVLGLAERCDAVVESFGPGGLDRRGIGVDALRARNPRLSVVSISNFGRTGPWRDRPASEFVLQGHCGSLGFRGTPDRPPLCAGGRLGEWASGAYAALGALAAIRSAEISGHGEWVDLSVFEVMSVTLNAFESLHANLTGDREHFIQNVFERSLEVPSIEPCADGWVGIAMFTAQMWQDFLLMIERTDLADDEGLAPQLGRWPRREEVYAAVHPWTKQRTAAEIIERASLFRIPAAPIGNGETLPRMDHFQKQGTFVANPRSGFLQPRVPYRLSRGASRPFEPAPRLGEHQAEVAGSLATTPPERTAAGAASGARGRPFAGLRVVDLSQVWAGPVVTHFLRAMGADVVKVESTQRPDSIRFASSKPPEVDGWWEYSWLFHGVNPGKRSVTLDLSRPEGVALVKRLIEGADLVIENFSPRVIESFGLGYEEIERINPRAVMVRMPGYGLDGPWRDRQGMAQTMEQISGLANVTGYPDGPPVVPRGPCDALAGLHACFAGLVALRHRDRTGRGQLVESIMVEAALNVAAEQVVEYSAYGHRLEREGNRGPAAAPQNLYACRGEEQWLALAVGDDAQWAALRRWLGDPAWAADPELADHAGRRRRQPRIDGELARVFATRDVGETADELAALGVPAAVAIPAPRLDENPQLRARDFFVELVHPLAGRQEYPLLPLRFVGGPGEAGLRAPPLLGQHNDEVLAGELGVASDELEALRAAGVVGERPAGL